MSAQILKFKTKIKSTKTTKKITKAMELVAASKMKQFQVKALNAKKYETEILEVLSRIGNIETENIYSEKRKDKDKIFILYTSDKGLCGGLNSKLIKTLFSSKEWHNTSDSNRKLITIGKKGYDYSRFNKIKVEKFFNNIDEKITKTNAVEIISNIIESWEEDQVSEIFMVSPIYKNSMIFYPTLKKFLPIEGNQKNEKINENSDEENSYEVFNDDFILEPNSQLYIDDLYQKIIYSRFFTTFMELKATEYSTRMIAMQNANKSASDMIERFTLKYNNARQASITQEIAEIVGGNLWKKKIQKVKLERFH